MRESIKHRLILLRGRSISSCFRTRWDRDALDCARVELADDEVAQFEEDGRTFHEGEDPYWRAEDLHYWQCVSTWPAFATGETDGVVSAGVRPDPLHAPFCAFQADTRHFTAGNIEWYVVRSTVTRVSDSQRPSSY